MTTGEVAGVRRGVLRMRRDRRGISQLMELLLFIAVVIVVFSITMLMNDVYDYFGDVEGCRLSILTAAYTKIASAAVGENLFTPHCPRRERTIVRSQVYASGKFEEDWLKRMIAEEFRQCWYMMGEGAQPFRSDWASGVYHCIICSTIKYDDRLKTNLGNLNPPYTEVGGMYDYLASTQMLEGGPGPSDKTYAKYVLDSYPKDAAGQSGLTNWVGVYSVPDSWEAYDFIDKYKQDESKTTKLPIEDLMIVLTYYSRDIAQEDQYALVIIPAKQIGDLRCEKTWN